MKNNIDIREVSMDGLSEQEFSDMSLFDRAEIEYIEDNNVQEILAKELSLTPEPYSSVIVMKYFDNLSDEEIFRCLVESYPYVDSTDAVFNLRVEGMRDLRNRVKSALLSI